MAIRCANCRGSHSTIAEVRECHGTVGGPPPTEKQVSFIRNLVRERTGHGITDVDALIAAPEMTTFVASGLIDELLKKPVSTEPFPADVKGEMPKHGTYTLVLEGGSHFTIRIRKPHPKANFVVAEYLFGPDNSSDFRRFARESESGFRMVGGLKDRTKWENALKALCTSSPETLAEMGFQYALKSGNCYRCGRKLTVPASIHRGMGPVCAGKE